MMTFVGILQDSNTFHLHKSPFTDQRVLSLVSGEQPPPFLLGKNLESICQRECCKSSALKAHTITLSSAAATSCICKEPAGRTSALPCDSLRKDINIAAGRTSAWFLMPESVLVSYLYC